MKQDIQLLDHMAGQALAGLLANPGGPIQANGMTGWGFANCNPDFIAGMAHELASAMLAEKARREATGKDGLQVDDHSPDAGNIAALKALNRELVWALETMILGWVDPYDDNDNVAKARAILAKAKEAA